MNKRFQPDAECVAAANAASGGVLLGDEIDAAFQAIADFKSQLEAAGDITNMGDKLRSFAERQAERTRFAAAVRKRHTALNLLVRDRQEAAINNLMLAGLSPREAILAVVEGTQRGVTGARKSAAALNLSYDSYFAGEMMADLQRVVPHAMRMLGDAQLDGDIVREMAQLVTNGNRGVTGNADALSIAKIFSSHAERARLTLNNLGATVGKLDGWFGVQQHDDVKLLAAGKEAWVRSILPRLDIARTFPDGGNLTDMLGKLFDEFVTGFPAPEIEAAIGSRVHPANLAKQLGAHRVLHFRSPDDALAYRAEFGYGNTFSGMHSYMRNAARTAALMDTFGPNPEGMFRTLVNNLRRRVADDGSLAADQRNRWVKQLDAEAGALKQAIDIATGLYSRPVNVTAAKISQDVRAVQGMAKLGGSAVSSIADIPTTAAASMFRGSGFVNGLVSQLNGVFGGRPKGEIAEISYLLGEGFDGLVGHIVNPAAAVDGPVGFLSKLQEKYFRWNGQSWWTDVNRASAARMIAAEMGMRAKVRYGDLPAAYRHVLGLNGIDEARWDAIRSAGVRTIDGKAYVTPDMVRSLPDDVVAKFARFDLGDNEAARGAKLADARRGLELDLLRFVADETGYGVLEPDARSRRFLTRGLRPGTFAGEAIRFIAQFKGFPVAFTQRVFGRALYGHRAGMSWETVIERGGHIGTLLAGLTVAGYVAMTVKDVAKGYWPPRPIDGKTLAAAMLQGGAAGIYGDYLFAQTNRFGGGPLEALAGPTIGAVADAADVALKARDAAIGTITGEEARMPAAEALTLASQNIPFANLIYAKPAIDALFLNSLREAVSPGYQKRQATRRLNEYGQRPIADYLSGAVQ